MARRTLDGMAAGGMYDLVGGGFHRYSVDDRWLVPHFEKMLYDNALLASAYLHAWVVTGEDAIARSRRRPSATLRELLLPEGGFASRRTPTRTASKGSPSPGRRRKECPRCWSRSSTAARSFAASSIPSCATVSSSCASGVSSRSGTTRRSPRGTGSRSRRWPRQRGGSSGATGSRRRAGSASSARSPLGRGRSAPAQPPRRPGERHRISGRLRERRARAARAARRDRRPPLAAGGEPAGTARGRALRRRRARRLLPLPGGRGAPRRPDEGAGRPSAPVRELDARARPPSPGPDLRRRRARAARGLGAPARPAGARARPVRVRLVAVRARPAPEPAAGAGGRGAGRLRGRPRGAPPWQPTTVVAVGPAEDVPLLAGKISSTGNRRLRLRAVRLPGAGDGSGSALTSRPGRCLS